MVELLSERQQRELDGAILQYLKPKVSHNGFLEVKKALNTDGNHIVDIPDNYLQKKWATVLRLQRSILDLETQQKTLQDENKRLLSFLVKENKDLDLNSLDLNHQNNSITTTNHYKLNWLPSKLKGTLRYHTASITAIAIHPYNPLLATASLSGDIVIWNLIDLSEPILILPNAHIRSINDLEFQPSLKDPLLASCSSDQSIKLWDITNALRNNINGSSIIPIMTLNGHSHIVSSIKFNKNGELISCSRDSTIRVWDINSGWTSKVINGHSDWVRNLSINDNSEWLLSCSSDTSIRLTHLPSFTAIGMCIGNDQVIEDVTFLPMKSNKYLDKLLTESQSTLSYDNWGFKYAISVDRSKLFKLWLLPLPLPPLSQGSNPRPNLNPHGVCLMEFKAHKSWIRSISVHPSGRWVSTCGDDGCIKIWDLGVIGSIGSKINNGTTMIDISPVKTLKHHENFVNVVKFAPPVLTESIKSNEGSNGEDEQNFRCYLISGGADELVDIWC